LTKISVVGASISGLSAAQELVKRLPEASIEILDSKSFPGERIVCGGGISKVMMEKVGLEVPKEFIASPIRAVRIYAPDKRFWELSGKTDYGYVLHREAYEEQLTEDLKKRNVVFKFGESAVYRSGFHGWHNNRGPGSDGLLYNYEKDYPLGQLLDEYIIGADGISGASTQYLGQYPREDKYIGVQLTAKIKDHPYDLLECYFGSRYAPKGYAWVFPAGGDRFRVGLGIPTDRNENSAQLLKNFLEDLKAEPVTHMEAKVIPTGPPPRNLVFGNILLVGDAGHLCDPLHGGGIANAVASGKAAAKAVAEGNLDRYNSYVEWIRKSNSLRYKFKNIILGMDDNDLNELVETLKGFRPRTLRLSWALMHAVVTLGVKNRKFFTKHKILRRLAWK